MRKGKIDMPCDYSKYPENWKEIREWVLARAENQCELCGAENGEPHWKTGSIVVLTIAHLDQDIENNEKYNLLAACQRCHNKIDLPHRIKRRKEKKRMKAGQMNIQDEIKVIATINRKEAKVRPIKPERMDYMEKGAGIGKPRSYVRK